MDYAYYGHYPHWFEKARGLYIRERGMSYAEVEERGVLLPVRDMRVRYFKPGRYDQELCVRSGISVWGRASLTFAYQVFGPPDAATLLCVGETRHACINRDGRPQAVPAWLREFLDRPVS